MNSTEPGIFTDSNYKVWGKYYLKALESENKQVDSERELRFNTWKQGPVQSEFPILQLFH